MSDARRAGPRQPYEKPRLRVIDLLAEEVLSVGCKLPAGSGPGVGTCLQGLTGPCLNPGS